MSWVTDVLLLFSLAEVYDDEEEDEIGTCEPHPSEGLEGVNVWLKNRDFSNLVKLDDHVSEASGKAMQAEVWGGAFNYLDIEVFVETVKQQQWQSPENVQLLIKDEEDSRFSLFSIV